MANIGKTGMSGGPHPSEVKLTQECLKSKDHTDQFAKSVILPHPERRKHEITKEPPKVANKVDKLIVGK